MRQRFGSARGRPGRVSGQGSSRYDHGSPSAEDALDQAFRPWRHKPVGFVGYGGPGAGVRAVEQLRQVVVELEIVPLRQKVAHPERVRGFDADGALKDPAGPYRQAAAVLEELGRWAPILPEARLALR